MTERSCAFEILGVRHHGPGSARSVEAALEELSPDLVVIEGPPELDALLGLAGDPELVPPVAALVYAVEEPRRSAFYPFAFFSPEWVAMRWALERRVDVRFADLPATHFLAPTVPSEEASDERPEPRLAGSDPISRLARAAGYDDPERFWEDAVEHRAESSLGRFTAIREAMAEIRTEDPVDRENERREAYMRKVLRAARREGRERVAMICGAYHAPVLHPSAWPKVADDNALLKGLPKIKVTATWAPWTAGRLAADSGYGAGVTSPGWYQHLYAHWHAGTPDDVVPGWLTRVARVLRAEGLAAAPATVVEAVRLAQALAAVRGRPSAGLDELEDATVAVLCEGSRLPLALVERTLVVGEELGQVPESAPLVPLAQDLARQQKRLRLKPSAAETTVVLDLRRETQRERSLLLHRLRLLGIDWATEADRGGTKGTFKEAWTLQWQPEFAVRLVEAGLYGTTVVAAAEGLVAERAAQAEDLGTLAELIDQALVADLPAGLEAAITALAERTAHQHDTLSLLRAIEPLARTQRYGDVRGSDTAVVAGVLHTVVLRAAAGLRAACTSLDDDAAAAMKGALDAAHRGVSLVGEAPAGSSPPAWVATWEQALLALAADDQVHGLLAGRVNRILLDSEQVSIETVSARLSRHLSHGTSPEHAAAWVDGLLEGEALLLLHEIELLRLLDEWVASVAETTFEDLLPLLRRTFSRFQSPERRQIGGRVRNLDAATDLHHTATLDLDLALPAAARVADLLQLEPA
ncbi:DUF5682 family protein [Nocardioides sp. NPDC057772]|uniref:DUF5682 family protein n=1 Tax=Nocardioides sp. NPDC057772 TaxID=3346245 RepID=UPI003670FB0A